jgi:cysteine desulfurase
VDSQGIIDLSALQQSLAAHDHTAGPPLVALMLANNETGAVQPVAAATALTKQYGGYLFCDAVQALGKIPVRIGELGADLISISAHKIGGPQGAGALILADEAFRPDPIVAGGGQEQGRRSGTENLIAIVGFGVAVEATKSHLREAVSIAALRAKLEAELVACSPDGSIASANVDRLPNTTLFVLPGIAAETMVIALDLEGIAVSAGSACSSGKISASPVLEAMGVGSDLARSGIRVSLLPTSGAEDVEAFISAWRVVRSRTNRSKAA